MNRINKQLIAELHFLPHQWFDKLFNIKWIKWVLIIEPSPKKIQNNKRAFKKFIFFKSSFFKVFCQFWHALFCIIYNSTPFFSIWQMASAIFSVKFKYNLYNCIFFCCCCCHSPPYLFIFICTWLEIEF